MENKPYFENLAPLENLFLDCVFWEFENEPIIFTCRGTLNSLYLCLCSELRGMQRWIISPTDIAILDSLVQNKIDIYTAIKMGGSEKFAVQLDISGAESIEKLEFSCIDELDLPKKGILLQYVDEDIKNYVQQLKNQKGKNLHFGITYSLSFPPTVEPIWHTADKEQSASSHNMPGKVDSDCEIEPTPLLPFAA